MSPFSPADPRHGALEKMREMTVEFERDGIPSENARRSLVNDSRVMDGRFFLRVHAFKPTGVALGYPLPSRRLEATFSALCDNAEEILQRICGNCGPVLSRVPPEAYHITLVNRTHFDDGRSKVRPMTRAEKAQAERIVCEQECGSIAVRYRGLLATKSGRLMVPALLDDTRVFRLKDALRDGVLGGRRRQPVLAAKYPVHTLTKLGHIVVPLEGVRLRRFLDWLREEGAKIDASARFTDAYTQLGRIPL